jgi:hypothetical protein
MSVIGTRKVEARKLPEGGERNFVVPPRTFFCCFKSAYCLLLSPKANVYSKTPIRSLMDAFVSGLISCAQLLVVLILGVRRHAKVAFSVIQCGPLKPMIHHQRVAFSKAHEFTVHLNGRLLIRFRPLVTYCISLPGLVGVRIPPMLRNPRVIFCINQSEEPSTQGDETAVLSVNLEEDWLTSLWRKVRSVVGKETLRDTLKFASMPLCPTRKVCLIATSAVAISVRNRIHLGCHARYSKAGRIRPVLQHLTPSVYHHVNCQVGN